MRGMLLRRFLLLLSTLMLACALSPGQAAACGDAVARQAGAEPAPQMNAALDAGASADASADASVGAADDALIDTGATRALPLACRVLAPTLQPRAPLQPCAQRLERPPR